VKESTMDERLVWMMGERFVARAPLELISNIWQLARPD
jgi:hypothetical protein